MTKVFWWKLQRELRRIGQQLQGVAERFTEPALQREHDAHRATRLKVATGQCVLGDKVALLLLYQPSGVSQATVWTCEHLVRKGYAPLVISNAPLSDSDHQRLAPVSWRTVERPNFGYDFGGYRDGIWLLEQWSVAPSNLIILNDSIWFPLYADEPLIDRMESSPADFVGALQLEPLRTPEHETPRKRPFFGSFFLMLKRPALEHPAFKSFWDHYRITSNKYKTIRQGERGFSHAMFDAGIPSEAMYSRRHFDSYVARISNPALCSLLGDLVTIDERIEEALAKCIEAYDDGSAWRETATRLALQATEKQNILATAPFTSLVHFEVPYLKKAKDWNNLKALRAIEQRMGPETERRWSADIRKDIHRVTSATL